jgi:hypothetical protein
MPSPEYRALQGLKKPPARSEPGDMWLCRRLGIVKVFNAHKRGSRHGSFCNNFHLYHWGKRAMWSRPADWRDNDPNASLDDPATGRALGHSAEQWEYLGNIFDLLPYAALAGN